MASQIEADKTLQFYQESLLKNPNLCYLAVVKEMKLSEKETDSFIIEAGVYNMETEAERKKAFTDKQMEHYQLVPDFLKIPLSESSLFKSDNEKSEANIAVHIKQTKGFNTHAYTARDRPVSGGLSISNFRYNEAGTLGDIMKLEGMPGLYLLSCWHVLYGPNGVDNDDILQPGVLDGGADRENIIADIFWYRLTPQVDAALARLKPGIQTTPGTRCFGTVNAVADARIDMRVKKCGRTTEVTRGIVISVNATTRIAGYPGGTAIFYNQILTTNMSGGGDSGALLLEDSTNNVVGLLIGGDENSQSIYNHFSLIFAPLQEAAFRNPHSLSDNQEIKFHSFY